METCLEDVAIRSEPLCDNGDGRIALENGDFVIARLANCGGKYQSGKVLTRITDYSPPFR